MEKITYTKLNIKKTIFINTNFKNNKFHSHTNIVEKRIGINTPIRYN